MVEDGGQKLGPTFIASLSGKQVDDLGALRFVLTDLKRMCAGRGGVVEFTFWCPLPAGACLVSKYRTQLEMA